MHTDPTDPHKHTVDPEHPGYETRDVNVRGIITFVVGLVFFVVVFFFVCWVMGKGINYALDKQDGPSDKWHSQGPLAVTHPGDRENLASNAEMQQKQLADVAKAFPMPRLQTDDGNFDTYELHSREDLLLENYSKDANGTVRIPISRAMELIAERGLPKPAAAAAPRKLMVGEEAPAVNAPLTTGFARTSFEQASIEAREQRNESQKSEEEYAKKK